MIRILLDSLASVLCVLLCFSAFAADSEGKTEVRIAFISGMPTEVTELALFPTVDYLKSKLGDKYTFQVFDISRKDLIEEIRAQRPNFLITPSEVFLQLSQTPQLGAHDIAALKSVFSSKTDQSVGSVFVTRNDRKDIQTISDMKGKRVAASNDESLSGWWAALGELEERGFEAEKFFSSHQFTRGRHLGVIEEVLSGASDVGILGTCMLEAYEASGLLEPNALKVIEPYEREQDEAHFYCRRSTRNLYPGAIMVSLGTTPDQMTKDVVSALFSMPPALSSEWAVGNDYSRVIELMKNLKFGFYSNLRDYSARALLKRHQTEILIAFIVLLFFIMNEARVHFLVNKRTAELKAALQAKELAEEEAVRGRKRLLHIERSGVISQMSNIIAHELKQPLGALINYAAVLNLRLKDRFNEDALTKTVVANVESETRRIASIVDSVRKFAKKEQPAHIPSDLVKVVTKAIRTFHQQEEAQTEVPFKASVEAAPIMADPLSLELLILNLIRNAASASKEALKPKVSVRLSDSGNQWCLLVKNNGAHLSDSTFEKLEHAAESTKAEGLGLGLAIVREIADMHGASLHFERNKEGGVTAELLIDKINQEQQGKTNG